LKKATVRVMLVITAGDSSGYMKRRIGISKKPPATPMSVPNAPINRPISERYNQIIRLSSLPSQLIFYRFYFAFNGEGFINAFVDADGGYYPLSAGIKGGAVHPLG